MVPTFQLSGLIKLIPIDEGILDGGVEIGNGAALIKANKNVKMGAVEWRC